MPTDYWTLGRITALSDDELLKIAEVVAENDCGYSQDIRGRRPTTNPPRIRSSPRPRTTGLSFLPSPGSPPAGVSTTPGQAARIQKTIGETNAVSVA